MSDTKQDKRPKTLLEYMGFKDPDIDKPEHDKIIEFIGKAKNLQKIINKLNLSFLVHEGKIFTEYNLADDYRSFGFLDLICINPKQVLFIEVKTTQSTFAKELREIEYYKDKLENNAIHGVQSYWWEDNKPKKIRDVIPILISPTIIPEQFSHQVHHITFEKIKEICN